MSDNIDVKIDASDLEKRLKKYALRDRNIDMSIAVQAMDAAMSDVISSEGAKGNQGKWKPFSPVTFKIHPKRIGGQLLQDTGILAAFDFDIKPREAEVYSPAPYAKHHVKGTKRKDGTEYMPRRDFTDVKWGPLLEDIADSMMVEVVKG